MLARRRRRQVVGEKPAGGEEDVVLEGWTVKSVKYWGT